MGALGVWSSVKMSFRGVLGHQTTGDRPRATLLAIFYLLFLESENLSKAKGMHLKLAKERRMTESMFTNQETRNMEFTGKVCSPGCF